MNLPYAIERLRGVTPRVRSPLESILGGNLQSNADPLTVQATARAPLFPKSA